MDSGKSSAVVIGAALILAGIGLLAVQFFEGISEAVVLFLIGGVFITGYLVIRSYWMLIPGCILMGLGLGSLGRESFLSLGESSLLGLGFGFIAIFVISKIYEGTTHWWPLIPGTVMLLVAIPSAYRLMEYRWQHWPLLLVVIGVFILIGAFRGGESK